MYKPKQQSQLAKRSTVAIRRVLRQGNLYTCGVCRKVHDQEKAADQCLARCLSGYLNPAAPVKAESTTSGKRYRCHFCKRIYFVIEEAKKCAAACRSQSEVAISAEASIDAPARQRTNQQQSASHSAVTAGKNAPAKSPINPVKKKRAPVRIGQDHKYLRDGRKLICRKCGLEHPTLDTVIACYDGHPVKEKRDKTKDVPAATVRPIAPVKKKQEPQTPSVTPAVAIAKEPAVTTKVAVSALNKTPAANDDHKFSRDGAKYVCRACKKKFFTRDDVCQCFDSHAAA